MRTYFLAVTLCATTHTMVYINNILLGLYFFNFHWYTYMEQHYPTRKHRKQLCLLMISNESHWRLKKPWNFYRLFFSCCRVTSSCSNRFPFTSPGIQERFIRTNEVSCLKNTCCLYWTNLMLIPSMLSTTFLMILIKIFKSSSKRFTQHNYLPIDWLTICKAKHVPLFG